MQPLAAIAVLTGLAMLSGPTGPGSDPEIGKPAPAFTLVDVQGRKHSLADYKGKTVVLEWANITCPIARESYKAGVIPALQKQYEGKDVVWLSMIITKRQQDENGENLVSEELAKSMAADMVQTYGASPTAILIDVDGAASVAYNTRTSMHLFVVDPKGMLVYDGALDSGSSMVSGRYSSPGNYVTSAIDETLAGQPVRYPKTMPYGCHPVGDNLPASGSAEGAEDTDDAGE